MSSLIGVVSDMHLRESLGYADFVEDRREKEKKEVLDFIVESFSDCKAIVLLGDMLNSRNNASSVIREYVELLERFGDKTLYVMAGNHEKYADGTSAIDFLKEIKNKPNWHVLTEGPVDMDGLTFLPYMHRAEVGIADPDEASEEITKRLKKCEGKILFAHHGFSGTVTEQGSKVDLFREVILPKAKLSKKFDLMVGGHIHLPQESGKTWVVGNVFCSEAGEGKKSVLKINTETNGVERIELPGRQIMNFENPKAEDVKGLKSTIARVLLTKKYTKKELESLKKSLGNLDAFVLIERQSTRKKKNTVDGLELMSTEDMLKAFAKAHGIDEDKLLEGWTLIKE